MRHSHHALLLLLGAVLFPLNFSVAQTAAPASPQVVTPRPSETTELATAYGFVVAQQLGLDRIKREFPALASRAQMAELRFKQILGHGVEGVEARIKALAKDEWSEVKAAMDKKLAPMKKAPLTKEQAAAFLDQVETRANGAVPAEILATLLSNHSGFQENPVAEFASGFTRIYRTGGHAKAKGLDVQFRHPISWAAREGERPNIIQKFTSGNGRGKDSVMVLIHKIPFPEGTKLTKEEEAEFFDDEFAKSSLPEGAQFISSKRLVLDNHPGILVVFEQDMQRLEYTLSIRQYNYVAYYNGYLVFLQGMTAVVPDSDGQSHKKALADRAKLLEPLFTQIANSLVLRDQYATQ